MTAHDAPAWRCLNCNHPHDLGEPGDGCDRCGYVYEETE